MILSFVISQLLTTISSIKSTLVVDQVTIAEGLLHLPLIFMSLHRTPLALALDDILCNGPWRMRLHDDDICLIPLRRKPRWATRRAEPADVPSAQPSVRWVSTPSSTSSSMETSENCTIGIPEAALAHPPAYPSTSCGAWSVPIVAMVPSLSALQQGITVCQGLDGRIALDECLLRSIVGIRE